MTGKVKFKDKYHIVVDRGLTMSEEKKPLSRSEREVRIKDKAGWVITVLAALLAVNTYVSSSISSKVLNNTIKANDTYSFYQSKSIKQSLAEYALEDAVASGNIERVSQLKDKISSYESDPKSGEGKKELLEKAQKLEDDRDEAKTHSPWLTFSGTGFQLAIVLLTASILAVSTGLFWGSISVGLFSAFLMSQGIWMWVIL